MSDNSQKLWLGGAANRVAQRHVNDAVAQLGYALPCSVVAVMGSIVTINFEVTTKFTLPQITVPVFGPEYIRYPIQKGCKGVAFPASVGIGNVTGLGPASAPVFKAPGNLSALVFFPVGNKDFSTTDDPNSLVLYGPDGVIIRTLDKTSTVTVNETGVTAKGATTAALAVGTINVEIINGVIFMNGPVVFTNTVSGQEGGGGIINFGDATITTTGPANVGTLASTGDVTAGGISVESHVHSGVQTGGGDTGPPV
jgi:hypothetical protein